MAANSGGLEWPSVVKSIISAVGGSINKNDVNEVVKAIIKSEQELLNHDEDYDTFYTVFAALAADLISANIANVSCSQIGTACQASRILLQFLLGRLRIQVAASEKTSGEAEATQALSSRQLLLPIKALCSGYSMLQTCDQVALNALVNNANTPPHIKNVTQGDKETSSKETKRSRTDLSNTIMERLTTPIHDYSKSKPTGLIPATPDGTSNKVADVPSGSSADPSYDVESIFITKNITSLQAFHAGDLLLDMCLALPHLSRYIHKCRESISKKCLNVPTSHSEATLVRHSLQALVTDLTLACSALSLPVLEPLTPDKLNKLSTLTISCLYCAICVTTSTSVLGISNPGQQKCTSGNSTTPKTEEDSLADSLSITIVEKALQMFSLASYEIKNSTKAGGHVVQNHLLLGVWVLVAGLQAQLSTCSVVLPEKSTSAKDDKGKSPSKAREGSSRINLMKIQQGFGVLSVALASRALTMMSSLLDDLQVEGSLDGNAAPSRVEPAGLDILGQYTALQRAARFLTAAPLNQLLYYLATISYRKACTLKRIQKHPPEGDNFSTSDSTTYYEDDMISCSEESSGEDDDSEPILGLWFEEIFSVSDTDQSGVGTQGNNENQDNKNIRGSDGQSTVVPEKGEPNGYILLATQIFQFMNKYFLSSDSSYMWGYVQNGLTEPQMYILAAIIRDVDRETARTETGTISVHFGSTLGALYTDFSQALTGYSHNLLARNVLSSTLQATLLTNLGVSPWACVPQETLLSGSPWPLQVYPRTLAILAQVLLLKPTVDKEAACISIWHRLIRTLVDSVCNVPVALEGETEDLNVEHAQLLLFLFHSLNLMQKKSVLLVTAGGVIRCADFVRPLMASAEGAKKITDIQLLHLARLLLLLEYLLKHLYDPPSSLLEQVQWNLFSATSLDNTEPRENSRSSPWMYFDSSDIETNYVKYTAQDDLFSMRPRFYSLAVAEVNNQLDGLACNFILGTPDKLKYSQLIDALLEVLNLVDLSKSRNNGGVSTFLGLCAMQYCFTISWRLLLLLPPPSTYMDRLALGEELPAGPLLLHSLVWGPRAAYKTFNGWMKDCLVKHGMYTQYAENLLKTVTKKVNNPKYDVFLAKNFIVLLLPQVDPSGDLIDAERMPHLFDLSLLDAVLARVHVQLDDSVAKPQPDVDTGKNSSPSEAPPPVGELFTDLLPYLLDLTEAIITLIRSSLVDQMNKSMYPAEVVDFRMVLRVASSRSARTSALASALMAELPSAVHSVLDKWSALPTLQVPWNTYANDAIPAEKYLLVVLNSHISSLSKSDTFRIDASLKHLLRSLVSFIGSHADVIAKYSQFIKGMSDLRNRTVNMLASITLDVCTDYLYETAMRALDKILGGPESEEHPKITYCTAVEYVYALLTNYMYSKAPSKLSVAMDVGILQECLTFLESLLDKPYGRAALVKFFDPTVGQGDLVKVLLSIAAPQTALCPQYGTRVLRFFNRLFAAEEKSHGDSSLDQLCCAVSRLASVEPSILQSWLQHVVLGGVSVMTSTDSTSVVTTVAPAPATSTEREAAAAVTDHDSAATSPADAAAPTSTATGIMSVLSTPAEEQQQALVQENTLLLQSLTTYMVKESGSTNEEAALALLKAIIPLGAQLLYPPLDGAGFSELMVVMATLADAGSGKGHLDLLPATTYWLALCKLFLCHPQNLDAIETSTSCSNGGHQVMLDACCCFLNYVGDVLSCLTSSATPGQRATSPPWEGEALHDADTDWADDLGHDDEDSSAEDSDEDSLCNKLCTFTVTQKEFMNQHWYHCHTCQMFDRIGVCTVCARVCHRGHDVTYAKYGNFFCDCGAKVDGNCQALVRRSPQTNEYHGANGQPISGSERTATSNAGTSGVMGVEQMLTSSLRRRASSPVNLDRAYRSGRDKQRLTALHHQLESLREPLLQLISQNNIVASVLELLNSLLPAVEASCQRVSPVGCHQRAQAALKALHSREKVFEHTDQLMVPTLGSQEGAFENVRMNYSGDQGQTIRQLLSAHMVRRVAMCCLSSPHGKRQHLAVSHEKGKITVLQLSALLKQPDSSKRKLTLTRLGSAPIPFTVLSVTGNQWNEDFLAVCGLKDCHVLTFTTGGSVAEHLVLHPQLETGNFIIRAIWLPGCQTTLALVTADFVKIYDLSKDVLSPQYYYLVPVGKIRDCTFVCTEDGVTNMMLMSSAGYIYSQAMDEESKATHGAFYVTNTLDVCHDEIKEVNGQVCGGGVSIYYSHSLQLLFFSFAQGKSFIAPLKFVDSDWVLPNIFPIQLNSSATAKQNSSGSSGSGGGTSSNGANKSSSSSQQPQPLCQWSEVPNHPGLVCSVMQSSNSPVILMIKPYSITVQEIKVVPAKAKIMDMVVIRHQSSSSDYRTTLILLCEDGSLRIYMASMEQTGYWLSSSVQATSPIASLKTSRKKKTAKAGKPTGTVSFPIDFFEHCQAMNDVEFGGNDLLQVYNTQQIKHRLNTVGMYVMSTKPTGFTLEISNTDNSLVMTGLRILLGSQDQIRAPSYVEIFGRMIPTPVTHCRWYDIPFTREEALQADKKVTIVFGPSSDTEGVTMVDSIKVYGKTKDALGWHEEAEEATNSTPSSAPPAGTPTENETSGNAVTPPPLTPLERTVSGLLEVLDGCFTLTGSATATDETRVTQRSTAIKLATSLLSMPTSTSVQINTKSLLIALHANKNAYHSYKDQALLTHVQQSLAQLRSVKDPRDLDAEAFYRLVLTARGVAVSRPHNLAKFADAQAVLDKTLTSDESLNGENTDDEQHMIVHMMNIMWALHGAHPSNLALAPVCVPGLTHIEATVHAMVEIIHAFTICDVESMVALAAAMYRQMLLHPDPAVSFSAKQALCRVLRPRSRRRRVYIPSPPHCSTPAVDVLVVELEQTNDTHNAVTGGTTEMESEKGPVSQPSQDSSEAEPHFEVDQVEPIMLLQADGAGPSAPIPGSSNGLGGAAGAGAANVHPMDALLGSALGGALGGVLGGALSGALVNVPGGFAPLLDIPPDADDETMVELAIALSLQDHEGNGDLQSIHQGLQQGLANLGGPALQVLAAQNLAQAGLVAQAQEAGHYSDTTASAGGSDDEGSTAATDGSTLRTSPAEQGGSAGSESGGSGVDSITGEHNVSGRSSAYGDNIQEPLVGAPSETSSLGAPTGFQTHENDGLLEPEPEQEPDAENTSRLHQLRLQLLDTMLQYIPQLNDVGGVRTIPFMQVLLMLTSDMDGEEEKDRTCLENMLNTMITELIMREPDTNDICQRTNKREVHLVIMRLLSVLMNRSKPSTKSSHDNTTFAAQTCAVLLMQSGVIDYCLTLLQSLLAYWKTTTPDEPASNSGATLLKPHLSTTPPDMSPFFMHQYVKGHASDVFEAYPHLLTEVALRLPYQVQKLMDNVPPVNPINQTFEQAWFYYLCEYMMTQQTPYVRRQVRKLLMYICGNKDKYRQLRDLHSLAAHVKTVQQCVGINGDIEIALQSSQTWVQLPYDALVGLVEQLKACVEVATSRTINWQRYCLGDQTVLPFLLKAACMLDEAVAPPILQLLECAVCSPKEVKSSSASASGSQPNSAITTPNATTAATTLTTGTANAAANSASCSTSSASTSRKEREKSEDSDIEARLEDSQCVTLVLQLNRQVPREQLAKFIKIFLLETNATTVRWQAHALILAVYRNSSSSEQESLLDLMWQLWPQLPVYGRKAAQFVDLLGYFSLKTNQPVKKMADYIGAAVSVLRAQNQLLSHHPNASLYSHLAQYVELDGYYLESEPCLVCNNPELPMASIKLSGIKIDSKFTTTTQIVKLVGSHTISKITLRIGDLKRTKMVRTINIYYNNRPVQAVVELKNKPAMWHKAKKVSVSSGQTEVKIEFPLPIVACNLMIEYADFYENIQASSETLQCPRCSASVPANPGVCANCGENVFQCHKCRAINYDEKDPFLCHACGFCKYAKFDYALTARQCCAVDPIENDEDRNKTVATINTHLEKADRVYKQLIGNKPTLEMLLLKISEHRQDRGTDDVTSGTTTTTATMSTQVNKAIQLLAQRYCGECRSSFEELSKIIQKVLACRRELIAYDRNQREQTPAASERQQPSNSLSSATLSDAAGPSCSADTSKDVMTTTSVTRGQCYGCASAATEHCLTLLRALACSNVYRQILCAQGLVVELADNNLRRGTVQVQEEVRQLLCLLTRDNPKATEELCSLLMERIGVVLRGHLASADLSSSVRHEMSLLSALVQKEDSVWEQKLRCVMQLFLLACKDSNSPVVLESITLPCLKILSLFIKPAPPTSKKNKDRVIGELASVVPQEGLVVDVRKWLEGDAKHTFAAWRQHLPKKNGESPPANNGGRPLTKEEARSQYLMEKYGQRWRQKALCRAMPLKLSDSAWLKQVLFNPSSRLARIVACSMLEGLCRVSAWKKDILDLLTGFLSELGSAGESASDFLALYQSLLYLAPWRRYLAVKGVLLHLADLITKEIEILHRLEETTLTSDLAQGYALKRLTELLASFFAEDNIKQQYKGRLVGAVLNGYLSLRRLVVQRTRLIDDTQEKLLGLLEEMTTGTEEETKAFMKICIETVQRCSLQDVRTPVFIFERLCSIIFPEENDVGEFFLTLEKDPQQEDFLQGRMLGNPYSSTEPGLGPLMRDVKNKICQDCELVALLEDDNGMELLVNNKIISLDLPVREVYKKVWVAEGGEGDAMRIIYRMRGLLGDATEEFVETLHAKSEQEVNSEDAYKMANVMADCGGLEIMLDRLGAIQDMTRSRLLLQVLLKLFRLCVKVRRNQEVLTQPKLGAMTIFLKTLQLCLTAESASLTQQLLDIMETVLSKAASQSLSTFVEFSQTFGGSEHIQSLLTCTTSPATRNNASVLLHLARVLAAITYGNQDKMALLCDYFNPVLNFNRFDFEHTAEDEHKLELFCILTAGIDRNAIGNTLKDYIISLNIVRNALDYVKMHAPSLKPTLLRADSDDWKEYISKPSLKYVLRFLTGLAADHPATQLAVAEECIPIIHCLEQVSSDEHVGSLSENLLEALRTHTDVASRIEDVREQTRAEKKRLAMAMREKQLGALGMHTNEKGQVTAKSTMLQQLEDLGEETGLVCVICREGYKFQPNKVLGIYTFTKRCNVEEFECKSPKTIRYSTVTHFNVVHVDCHMSAVRLARGRDEWESAALQNANTKCNGLLPLWGPQVPESAFASCLARHNTYLQECSGHRDITYYSTVQDLKLLLLRFAQEKSFHDDTGGGGPQSNMQIIPYLLHMALYVINTTRSGKRELKALQFYVDMPPSDRWIQSSFAAEGPLYWMVFSLLLDPPSRWMTTRFAHLKRLLVLAQARHLMPSPPSSQSDSSAVWKLTDISIKDYSVYKPYLIFFGLIDGIYFKYFKDVTVSSEEQWPVALADYIRHNDEALLKASERLMTAYREELLPCASLDEFCDVLGLLEEVPDPNLFMEKVFKTLI